MLRSISPGLRLLLLAAAFLFSLGVCASELSHTYWLASPNNNYIRYPYLLEDFKAQFDAGIWYPRWLSSLYGGYGYPTFLYTPPGYFYFSLPFSYLAPSADTAAKLSNLACIFIAVTGYYSIARILGNRVPVSIALALFAFLNVIWFHGAFDEIGLSQRFAFSFALWGVFFLLKLAHRIYYGKNYFINVLEFSLVTLAVLITHVHIALLYIALLGVVMIGAALGIMDRPRRRVYLISVFTGLMLAVTLSSPYWYPALSLREFINIDMITASKADQWFSSAPSLTGFIFWHWTHWDDSMPYQPIVTLEACMYGLLLMAVYYLRSVKWIMPSVILYELAMVLLLPASQVAWNNVPLLQALELPQRLQYLTHLIEYLVFSLATSHLFFTHPHKMIVYPTLVLMLALCVLVYHPFSENHILSNLPDIKEIDYADARQKLSSEQFLTFQTSGEFTPKTAHMESLPNRYQTHLPAFSLASMDMHGITLSNLREGTVNEANVSVDSTAQLPVRVQLNQLYFPGWSMKVKSSQPDSLAVTYERTAQGLMSVLISKPGTYNITAYYSGPAHWQIRNLMAALGAIILITLYACYYVQQTSRHKETGTA